MTRLARPLLLETPCCVEMVMKQRFASFNSFGVSSRWSDGYVSMPFSSEVARLGYCPTCNQTYWLEDAKVLGVVPSGDSKTKQRASWFAGLFGNKAVEDASERVAPVDLLGLDFVDYHQQPRPADLLIAVLREEWNTTEREIYLRTRLWWIGNHSQRGLRKVSPMTDEQNFDNMHRLLVLHQTATNVDQNAEVIAELLRHTGLFDEAIAVLGGHREQNTRAAMIQDAAGRGESHVFEVETF